MVNQTLTTCHQIHQIRRLWLRPQESESDNLTSLPSTVHVSRVSPMFPAGQEVRFWFSQATNESPDVLIDQFKCEPAKGVVKKDAISNQKLSQVEMVQCIALQTFTQTLGISGDCLTAMQGELINFIIKRSLHLVPYHIKEHYLR